MTRLRTEHIADLPYIRESHAARLRAVSGLTLAEVAALSLDVSPVALAACRGLSVAVIPVSSGEGRIEGFDLALAAIAGELGFQAEITAPDQAGVCEAADMDLCLWADDDLFVAHHLASGAVGENGEATGRGFATVLHVMLQSQQSDTVQASKPLHLPPQPFVLVRGCGPVGSAAARRLGALGYPLIVCDVLADRAERLARRLRKSAVFAVSATPENLGFVLAAQGVQTIPGLLDAAPIPAAPGELPVDATTCIAAPGVPCLWNPQTRLVWHDPLETGTAVMLAAAALGIHCGWDGLPPSPVTGRVFTQPLKFPTMATGVR